MSDRTKANADSKRTDPRRKNAVGNGDVLAMHILIFDPLLGGTERDRIVSRIDNAIGHRNITACINVNAVGIQHPDWILYRNPTHLHVFASVNKTSPARRVYKRYITYLYIFRFNKADHLTGA
jgi:hypothetical protein